MISIAFDRVFPSPSVSCRQYLNNTVIPDFLNENGLQKAWLAQKLELSSSELRRKLSPCVGDKRNFSLDDLEKWLGVTKDLRPLFYLFEKYSADHEDELARLKARVAELESATTTRRGR